jgi:hypothetical protein
MAAVAINYFAYNLIKIHKHVEGVARDGRWCHHTPV